MRTLALAAVIGIGLTAGGIAAAETYNDPGGRFTFNAPSGWRTESERNTPTQSVALAFNPTNDCFIFGADNPGTATSSANAARNTTAPLAADAWVRSAAPITDFFSGATPTLTSQSVDTSGFWPVQRAELGGGAKTVYGAILVRPGVEIRAFCAGATSASAYDTIFASLGHPNDATWRQQAESAAAAAAAAPAAAPATQPEEQQSNSNRRRNRD